MSGKIIPNDGQAVAPLLRRVGRLPGLFRMFGTFCGVGAMMFMKLLGAIRAFEFMAFAGDGENGNGHKEDGEKFHRAASIATRRRNATPKAIFITATFTALLRSRFLWSETKKRLSRVGRGVLKNNRIAESVGALHKEGTLADALTEIVKLGAADLALVRHLDLRNPRSMKWENPLHSLAV